MSPEMATTEPGRQQASIKCAEITIRDNWFIFSLLTKLDINLILITG